MADQDRSPHAGISLDRRAAFGCISSRAVLSAWAVSSQHNPPSLRSHRRIPWPKPFSTSRHLEPKVTA